MPVYNNQRFHRRKKMSVYENESEKTKKKKNPWTSPSSPSTRRRISPRQIHSSDNRVRGSTRRIRCTTHQIRAAPEERSLVQAGGGPARRLRWTCEPCRRREGAPLQTQPSGYTVKAWTPPVRLLDPSGPPHRTPASDPPSGGPP
jgi:hypothetical protein